MQSAVIGILFFTVIILVLVSIVMAARALLLPSGYATVAVNGGQALQVPKRGKLLLSLADNGIILPAACGGKGSCGQCRVQLLDHAPPPLPTERAQLTRGEIRSGYRLACALRVRGDLNLQLPDELLEIQRYSCEVLSNRNIATFLKELVLRVPSDMGFSFEAGQYILLESPPYELRFADFDIPPSLRADWAEFGYLEYTSRSAEKAIRAYSLANYPEEGDIITLVVRIAFPPPSAPQGTPPGLVSSYIFGLKPGDTVVVAGPFGDFHATDSDREMVLIGGGAGIAPLRSIILDQLLNKRTQRKITFWYGARSRKEICYQEDFDRLASEYSNFEWQVVLSESHPDNHWTGYFGFVHESVHQHFLADHPAPEEAEYYICGPPLMSAAVIHLLEDFGVDRDSIFIDSFESVG